MFLIKKVYTNLTFENGLVFTDNKVTMVFYQEKTKVIRFVDERKYDF